MSTDTNFETELTPVSWAEAMRLMNWYQGEHVTLIGPTGVGKTELAVKLAEYRPWCIFLNTKRIDDTQKDLKRQGFRTVTKPRSINPEVASRYLAVPPWPRTSSVREAHRKFFKAVLDTAYYQTAWTVIIDELEYINRDLKIEEEVNQILRQGRAQGNTLILGTQRPRYVTLHAYEQATHLFLWRQSDMSNVERSAELAGVNADQVFELVQRLGRHDCLYVNTVTGLMFPTNTRKGE